MRTSRGRERRGGGARNRTGGRERREEEKEEEEGEQLLPGRDWTEIAAAPGWGRAPGAGAPHRDPPARLCYSDPRDPRDLRRCRAYRATHDALAAFYYTDPPFVLLLDTLGAFIFYYKGRFSVVLVQLQSNWLSDPNPPIQIS